MLIYPGLPDARRAQILRDAAVLAAILAFAVIGIAVRSALISPTAISEDFTGRAGEVQAKWNQLGERLARVPVIGENLEASVTELADATSGNALAAGEAVTQTVTNVANILGLTLFAIPTLILLLLWVPARLSRAHGWAVARDMLGERGAPAQLLAMRALTGLPLAELARHTPDPFEAYRAGHYQPLVEALYRHEGVVPPRPSSTRPGLR